jgi:hypothetical protein
VELAVGVVPCVGFRVIGIVAITGFVVPIGILANSLGGNFPH